MDARISSGKFSQHCYKYCGYLPAPFSFVELLCNGLVDDRGEESVPTAQREI